MQIPHIDYEMLFSTMVIKPDWENQIRDAALRILLKKENYDIAVMRINQRMPWYFVGIIHSLECGLSFTCHFHNGDSLKKCTVHQPAGRPVQDPVNGAASGYTWMESVIDAMQLKGFDKQEHWCLKDMLFRYESYNGFGYEKYHQMHSPYLWSGTNHYEKGKYDEDGKFNADLISKQVGAAPLLRYLTDKTIGIVK